MILISRILQKSIPPIRSYSVQLNESAQESACEDWGIDTPAIMNNESYVDMKEGPVMPLTHKYMIYGAALLQRNPLTIREYTSFERAYEKYQILRQSEISRGIFNISTVEFDDEPKKENGSKVNSSKMDNPSLEQMESVRKNMDEEQKLIDKCLWDLRRLPDRKLYMMIRADSKSYWDFPRVPFTQQHLETANINKQFGVHSIIHAHLNELLGSSADLYHLGRAPVAHFLEEFRDRVKEPLGGMNFLFKSQLVSGTIRMHRRFTRDQVAWLCADELADKNILPNKYYMSIKHALSY